MFILMKKQSLLWFIFDNLSNIDKNLGHSLRHIMMLLRHLHTVSKNLDILTVAEEKIDDYFPKEQLHIGGYGDPLRLDRYCGGEDVSVKVKKNITARQYLIIIFY